MTRLETGLCEHHVFMSAPAGAAMLLSVVPPLPPRACDMRLDAPRSEAPILQKAMAARLQFCPRTGQARPIRLRPRNASACNDLMLISRCLRGVDRKAAASRLLHYKHGKPSLTRELKVRSDPYIRVAVGEATIDHEPTNHYYWHSCGGPASRHCVGPCGPMQHRDCAIRAGRAPVSGQSECRTDGAAIHRRPARSPADARVDRTRPEAGESNVRGDPGAR
jgi:hypothetical protein